MLRLIKYPNKYYADTDIAPTYKEPVAVVGVSGKYLANKATNFIT